MVIEKPPKEKRTIEKYYNNNYKYYGEGCIQTLRSTTFSIFQRTGLNAKDILPPCVKERTTEHVCVQKVALLGSDGSFTTNTRSVLSKAQFGTPLLSTSL